MKSTILLLAGCVALMQIAGCGANPPSPTQQLDAVELAYTAITNDETAYANSSVADPKIVAALKSADAQIYPLIVSYRTAVESGASASKADLTALAEGLSQTETALVNAKAISATDQALITTALTALNTYIAVAQ